MQTGIVVIMGVACSGKSSIGARLGQRLGWRFIEADDYHPEANIAKMRAGSPLSEADRSPWLNRLTEVLQALLLEGESAVLACSALRAEHRAVLRVEDSVRFFHLLGDYELLAERCRQREDHFMPVALLRSQFETLEIDADIPGIDVGLPMEAVVESILRHMKVQGQA